MTVAQEILGEAGEVPLSESAIPKLKEGSQEDVVADLRGLAEANPERAISRNWYRGNGRYAESAWNRYFGSFEEFKRQAGLTLTRPQHRLEREIAKHASVDHYRKLNIDRANWGGRYLRERKSRMKTILYATDLHDEECDLFVLRVFIDTAHRLQPDVICLGGDIFDLAEFGKYGVDPREWDVVRRIKFVHDKILGPLRNACPNAQIDFIEGNHEARLLRHLADETPALRAVLADLHGWTISKLLGIDQFEINYHAKADLAAWTQRDFKEELANNYKIYWDAFLVHHFPDARSMGLPGVNGHHHSHRVWPMFSPIYGAYEWTQSGAGHIRSATYCKGEKWHNGFLIVHVDTETKSTVAEYSAITDFACVGGTYYHREPNEAGHGVPKLLLAA